MISRALGLPSSTTLSRLTGRGPIQGAAAGDLTATPDPRRTLHWAFVAVAVVAVPVVLATAEGHLGPGVTAGDVLVLCAAYVAATIATLRIPWQRLDEHWLLGLVALPVVFVASLNAITGAGSSPYSALYAPILAVAGWYLPIRHALAALGLVVVTEIWRALAMDQSRSVDQLAVVLPFDVAVAAVAYLAGNSLRGALTNTRREQVRMAATLDAIRDLGADPDRTVFLDLQQAMARVFDAEVQVVRFGSQRPDERDLTAALLEPNVATVLVPGSAKLHAVVRLVTTTRLSAHDLRLAAILAEAAGRTADARDAIDQTRAETERDPLTGVFNRRALDRHLGLALESARASGGEVSLLFLDVDDFKKLNDVHGHSAGDAVLVHLAAILRDGGRHGDGVYRFGGDEFAILLPMSGATEALAVANRIMLIIANSDRRANDLPVPAFHASVGIAVSKEGWTAGDLLATADAAMYEAKRAGGASIRIDQPLSVQVDRRQ